MIDALDSISYLTATDVGLMRMESTDTTITDGNTLTATHPCHKVVGAGAAAATLDASSAIADGQVADQLLLLQGTDNTATVTVPDSANTDLNGLAVLASGDTLLLRWDTTDSVWTELLRNS